MAESFRMPPAPQRAFAVFDEAPRFLRPLVGLLQRWGRGTRFESDADTLRIRGTLYQRRIRRDQLRPDQARRIDLTTDSEFTAALRTNGIGLPGYSAGWFRLKSGEKALAFVTDPERVVYVPTRKGYALLLSVDEPEAFLRALRDPQTGHAHPPKL